MKFFSVPLFIAISKPLNIFKMVTSETASRFQALSSRSLSLLTVYFLIIGYISILLCASHSFHFHNILDISTKLPVERVNQISYNKRYKYNYIFVVFFPRKEFSIFLFQKLRKQTFICLFGFGF